VISQYLSAALRKARHEPVVDGHELTIKAIA